MQTGGQRAPSTGFGAARSSLSGDEVIHGHDGGLGRENLPGENTMDFGIGVEAGVAEDDAVEIEVECAAQGGEGNAAGGDAEEDEVFDAARAEDQVEFVFTERAHALLVNDQFTGAQDGAVDFNRGGALDEQVGVFHPLERGGDIGDFGVAGGKSQAHMDDVE